MGPALPSPDEVFAFQELFQNGEPLLLGGVAIALLVGLGYAGTRVWTRVQGGTDATPADDGDDETEFSVSYTPIDTDSDDSWTADSSGVARPGGSSTNGGTPSAGTSTSGTSGGVDAGASISDDDEEETGTDTRIFTGTRNVGAAATCPDCEKDLPANEEFEFCPFCGRGL